MSLVSVKLYRQSLLFRRCFEWKAQIRSAGGSVYTSDSMARNGTQLVATHSLHIAQSSVGGGIWDKRIRQRYLYIVLVLLATDLRKCSSTTCTYAGKTMTIGECGTIFISSYDFAMRNASALNTFFKVLTPKSLSSQEPCIQYAIFDEVHYLKIQKQFASRHCGPLGYHVSLVSQQRPFKIVQQRSIH